MIELLKSHLLNKKEDAELTDGLFATPVAAAVVSLSRPRRARVERTRRGTRGRCQRASEEGRRRERLPLFDFPLAARGKMEKVTLTRRYT